MGLISAFRDWRRQRVLARARFDETAWRETVQRYPFTRNLSADELVRLRELVILFLNEKAMNGAGGFTVRETVRIAVALQACILVLNLGLDYYRGWVEIIVYPDEFVVEYDYEDENGVVHRVRQPMTGEAWEGGPVILSWADAEQAGSGAGYNVVIHEFAHKLDMLGGGADGMPALHPEMSRESWAATFQSAYDDFCSRLDRGEHTRIDPYAGESPSEFFAVVSEAFFETPDAVIESYPAVYRELAAFYRQDPLARAAGAGSDARRGEPRS